MIFFEEVEEANKLLKEQELKNIESTEKKEDSFIENKMITNSIKSFNKANISDKNKNDLNSSKNLPNEERALSQGILKNSKEEENGTNINTDEQALNFENNKSNNENSNSSNNSVENNSDNNKTENNNSQNNSNEVIDKTNGDTTNVAKDNENDISNNIKKTGNLIVDLDEVNLDGQKSNSRKSSIKKASTNNKILKKLVLEKLSDRDKEISVNDNTSLIEKEMPEEEKSSSKLIDLSLKRSSVNLSQSISNPEFKEQINSKYKECYNEIDKYIQNILELDSNDHIHSIISKLNFYDKKHNYYSNIINDEDICSIIAYALTSDQYLDAVKIDKNGLNDIKSEFVNNEINEDGDNDLFCNTSLLYDKDNMKFTLGNLAEEKIIQILENELLSSQNKKCVYDVTYNPSSIFNEVFEKKKKKENKSTNAKINYANINQNLYLMSNEIKNVRSELENIIKDKFEDFNKKFTFTSTGTFMEDKISPSELKITSFVKNIILCFVF